LLYHNAPKFILIKKGISPTGGSTKKESFICAFGAILFIDAVKLLPFISNENPEKLKFEIASPSSGI